MLINLITHYGYAALFGLLMFGIIGIPVPDELLLLYAGYNISVHRMDLLATLIIASFGAMCGITVSYLIGRFVGLPAIRKFGRFVHITDDNSQKAHNWFERRGSGLLLLAIFFLPFAISQPLLLEHLSFPGENSPFSLIAVQLYG